MRRGTVQLRCLSSVFSDPQFQATFSYSVIIGLFTIVVGMLIVVPAAYFVRLRLPWLRPYLEFVTLLPLIIPPIILVFGYIRLYNSLVLAAAHRQRARHQHPADLRLCGARPALHVPGGRYRPAHHRRAHADRGGQYPRRGDR